MAQLRQDYDQFVARDIEVVAIGPEELEPFADYFENEALPFIGLPDPEHRVAELYSQEVNALQLGRMPAQVLIDKNGLVRFAHYGGSMRDIPDNQEILDLADKLGLADEPDL